MDDIARETQSVSEFVGERRRNFEVLNEYDSALRADLIDNKKNELWHVLRKFLHGHGEHIHPRTQWDEKNWEVLFELIAEATVETSEVLGFETDPSFEIYENPEGYVGAIDPDDVRNPARALVGEHTPGFVGLNYYELVELAELVRSSPIAKLRQVPDSIRTSVAEEMAHIYVSRRYKISSLKGVIANLEWRLGSRESYHNDRGENFSKGFAKRYVEFKHEQQHRDRQKARDSM